MSTAPLMLAISVLVGQPTPPLFREYQKAMTFYYLAPDPALGPRMLKDLLKKENLEHPWFAKNEPVLHLIAVQLGYIAAGKPAIVRKYEALFPGAPPAGQRVIVRALMDCGDQQTLRQVESWLADQKLAGLRVELTDLKKHLEDPARKRPRDQPARTPHELDRLWSDFFITGEYQPIARLLDVLDLPGAPENAVLKRVARWSLASNLQQHARLRELVRDNVNQRPESSRKVCEKLLALLDALPGRWLSQDGDAEPLVFGKDGSFQCGFIKEDGKWAMAKGVYTITGEEKIATRAEHKGSTLTQTFTFTNGVVIGSRGPNPRVEWKKQ
jgi:hypothetical protein